ncbi:hypothetical protein LguiB_024530 [Lonicera macranthoides]
MYQHHSDSNSRHYHSTIHQQEEAQPPPSCCSTTRRVSAELKLYQAFIFSVPIFFTFVLLLLFYLLYLRRRRLRGLSSLQMRTSNLIHSNNHHFSRTEMGLKKEVREMLPIIVFKESFSVRDTLCSVCLGEYQAEDRLQQIPACGHTFHMDCIDHWLSTHTTCPLCRLSLLPSSTKPPSTPQPLEEETSHTPSIAEEDEHESSIQSCSHSNEDPPAQHLPETSTGGQINSETGSAAVEIVGV